MWKSRRLQPSMELRWATVLVSIPSSQKMAAFSFPRNGKELSDMLIFALSRIELTLFLLNLRRQGSIEPNISTSNVCHSQLPEKDSQLQMTWRGWAHTDCWWKGWQYPSNCWHEPQGAFWSRLTSFHIWFPTPFCCEQTGYAHSLQPFQKERDFFL